MLEWTPPSQKTQNYVFSQYELLLTDGDLGLNMSLGFCYQLSNSQRAHMGPAPLYPAGCSVSIGIVGAFKCYFLSLSGNVCFLQWSLCSTVLVFAVWNVMFAFAQNPLSLTQGSPIRNTSVSEAPFHVISDWVKNTCPSHLLLNVWLPALPITKPAECSSKHLWLAYYYFLPIYLTISRLTLQFMLPPVCWIEHNTLLPHVLTISGVLLDKLWLFNNNTC